MTNGERVPQRDGVSCPVLGRAGGGRDTALLRFPQAASAGLSGDVGMGIARWQRELLGNLATLLPSNTNDSPCF